MDVDVEVEPIVQPLLLFLKSRNKQPPREFTIILENKDYIQNKTISIFLAKVIRFIESNNVNLNLMDNTRSSLPPSIYYGIVHPSSDIRQFCRDNMMEKHTKNSFTNVGDYTNIIQPIIKLIQQTLSFMGYTQDTQHFDTIERNTKALPASIKSTKNGTNDGLNVQLVESHLYSGLKLFIDKLSDDIVNNHLLPSSDTDLWNILLSRMDINVHDIDNNEDRSILSNCCSVLKRILKCNDHYLLWEHRHLLIIPNVNELITKLCDIFMYLCEFPSNKLNVQVHKDVILLLESTVQSKAYIHDNVDDLRLIHRVLDSLLLKCWKKCTLSQIGIHVLNIAFRIIGRFLNDDDHRHIIFSLTNQWSKTCINFAIAGNINDDDDPEQNDIRQRLSLYRAQITNDNIITLQSNRVTTIVSQSLMTDTKNVTNIVQTFLFSNRYLRQYGLNIASYRPYNAVNDSKRNRNDGVLYQNNVLWNELLSTDIDAWNYPASVHKLMFEMYNEIAIWDQLEKYPFRDPNDDSFIALKEDNINTLREYFAVYTAWVSRIKRYFDIVANKPSLAVSILSTPSVLQHLISSYVLSGNDEIKTKMDEMIHSALNLDNMTDENNEKTAKFAVINESLAGKDLKLLLRHLVIHRGQFLRMFDFSEDVSEKIKEYNEFVHSIVDGVMMSIALFEKTLKIITEIPALFKDNPRMRLKYFFPVKEHIVSVIANICNFMDYFRSNNIKWEPHNHKNNHKVKLVDRCFSEIIFSSSSSIHAMIDYILMDIDGIIGCSVGEFIRNRYFEDNEARIQDVVHILSFLSNHWNKYIFENKSFDYKHLFDWFEILKYPQIGKEWINLMTSITGNNEEIRERFIEFSKNERNTNSIIHIVDECFDANTIKIHQTKCKDIKCCWYHLEHREQFTELLGDFKHRIVEIMSQENDNDLGGFAYAFSQKQTNGNGNGNHNQSTMPLRKKPKKIKQFKITEYYSSPSLSVTPGGSMSPSSDYHKTVMNSKVEVDADNDTIMSISALSSNTSTPKPKTFMMNSKPIIKIQPFRILDKQLFAVDNKLMYYVDYTDASKNGPDWKYRKEIMDEFGDLGKEIITKWNKENRDKEIETMWGVQKILDKRVNREKGGAIEYKVLWDTPTKEVTWESIDNLDTCQLAIHEFERERTLSGKKRIMPLKPNVLSEPIKKKRRIQNKQNSSDSDDIDIDEEEEDDDDSLDGFMVHDYSEDDSEYDPNIDKNKKCKTEKNNEHQLKKLELKVNNQKEENDKSVSLKFSDIESDVQDSESDSPLFSANHSAPKVIQKHRNLQKPRDRHKPNPVLVRNNNTHQASNHQHKKQRMLRPNDYQKKKKNNDISSHLSEMMNTCYNFNTNSNSSTMVAPCGDIVPTSNISASFKKSVSKSSGSSKLSKLHRDHRNSILAGNVAAKKSNMNQFRKADRSKSGNFKKRKGGAVILPTTLARRNRMNQSVIPKNAKISRISKISKIPTKPQKALRNKPRIIIPKKKPQIIPKNNNISNKLKQKLPQRRNKFDNTLFKKQHKTHNQYNHKNYNNFGGNRNGNNNCSSSLFRDCHIELFSKILKWIPNHVESALNETKIDLTPMGDEYENAIQYKILFEPFLLEESRAQIAQIIQEKKDCRLIKREVQDKTGIQRNKNTQYQHSMSNRHNKHQILYDTTRITHYTLHPTSNLSSLKLQPLKPYVRLNKTYYIHDLVLLVQDLNLTKQYPSNALKIDDIINTSILGIVKTTNDKELFEVYINSENTEYRAVGSLCAIVHLNSLITPLREYRCLSTMVENIWASRITKPNTILPVDGITLQNIRDKQLPQWMREKMNKPQLNAISATLCRENNITLIKGPPGTGKTTTIVALINAALLGHGFLEKRQRPKILVCAPSNAAIDTVIKRAYKRMKSQKGDAKLNIKMVRIGSGTRPNTVAAEIQINKLLKSLNPQFKEEALQKELKLLRKQKEELTVKWKKSKKLAMNGNDEEKNREKCLAEKLRTNHFKKKELETKIQQRLPKSNMNNFSKPDKTAFIREQDVVFSTLSASASTFLNPIQFDLLIIDESTQACELSTLIPFQLNIRSIVLVGDEKQLPATVISNQCETFGYTCSFFERCLRNNVDPYLLTIQYRMHPDIRRWPSATFYANKLEDGPNIIKEVVPFVEKHSKDPRLGPYAFFDIYHQQEAVVSGKTYTNRAELDFILRLLDYMSRKFYSNKSRWNDNVGIVTPYRGQVNLFRKHLQKHQNKLLHRVVVDTVESFQGSEKDIIVFSCVRSQREPAQNAEKANLGFLTDLRRLNVALTRARLCCFIVGNSNTLKSNKTWKALIRDAHTRGCIYKVANQDHKEWLKRPSAAFVSTLQETKNMKHMNKGNSNNNDRDRKMNTMKDRKRQSMEVDDDSASVKSNSVISTNSQSSSSSTKNNGYQSRANSRSKSHSSSRNRHKSNNHDRHKNRYRHKNRSNKNQNNQKRTKHRLTDAEIARILNLPEPPTDPRRRR